MFTYDLKSGPLVHSAGEGVPGDYRGRRDMLHGFSKGSSDFSERPGLVTSRKLEALDCAQFVICV